MVTRTRAALAMLAAVTLVACSDPEPVKLPEIPVQFQASIRWIPTDHLDLLTAEGTFVRAIAESWINTRYSCRDGRDAYQDGYPGFEHAYNNANRTYRNNSPANNCGYFVLAGTMYFRVLRFERTATGYTANVCRAELAVQRAKGESLWTNGGFNYELTEYGFGPDPALPADQQHAPPANQRGPGNAPVANMFGTWVLTQGTHGPRGPHADHLNQQCDQLPPGVPAPPPDKELTEPPPTLPPDPGWPTANPS